MLLAIILLDYAIRPASGYGNYSVSTLKQGHIAVQQQAVTEEQWP